MVCLIEFVKYKNILALGDDLLDLEYKIMDQEHLTNYFEFQKNKWDFLEFKELVGEQEDQLCYAIPNIIYRARSISKSNSFSEVNLISWTQIWIIPLFSKAIVVWLSVLPIWRIF
jgi:hypothetical protein